MLISCCSRVTILIVLWRATLPYSLKKPTNVVSALLVRQLPLSSLGKLEREALICGLSSGTQEAAPNIGSIRLLDDSTLRGLLNGARKAGTHSAKLETLVGDLQAFVSGRYAELLPDPVSVRPPRQRISATCSLLTEMRGGRCVDGADNQPIGCAEDDRLSKWLGSCTLDVLQRSVLHRCDHGLLPARLEVSLLLLDIKTTQEKSWSTSCELERHVTNAIDKGLIAYEESEEGECARSERKRCQAVVMSQALGLVHKNVAKACAEGYSIPSTVVKKLMVCFSGFVCKGHDTADIREAWLPALHPIISSTLPQLKTGSMGFMADGDDTKKATHGTVTLTHCDEHSIDQTLESCTSRFLDSTNGSLQAHDEAHGDEPDAKRIRPRVVDRLDCTTAAPLHVTRGNSALRCGPHTSTDSRSSGMCYVSVRVECHNSIGAPPAKHAIEATIRSRLLHAFSTLCTCVPSEPYALLPDQAVLLFSVPIEAVSQSALDALHANLTSTVCTAQLNRMSPRPLMHFSWGLPLHCPSGPMSLCCYGLPVWPSALSLLNIALTPAGRLHLLRV